MNSSRYARSKWGVEALLAAFGMLLAPAAMATVNGDADDGTGEPVNFVAFYSHGGNAFNTSPFPVTSANGFARRSDAVSLSVDGMTANWSWRVRALQTYDPQHGSHRQLRLKELNRIWRVSDHCDFSAGKRILAWDVGFLAQPVGFFQTQTVLTDLDDVAGNSEGLPLLLYSCSLGRGLALDLVRSDDVGRDDDYHNLGLHQTVARLSGQVGNASFALLARRVDGQGEGWGATWSAVPSDTVELHASVYSHKGQRRLENQGAVLAPQFWRTDPYQTVTDGRYRTQALLGVNWTPRDLPVVTLEVSHNDAGLSGDQWRRWKDLVRFHQDPHTAVPAAVRDGNLLWDLSAVQQQGTRRDYAYLQLQSSLLGQSYSIGNEFGLNDRSYATFIGARTNLSRSLFVTGSYSHFSHRAGTEFSYLPVRNAFTVRAVATF